MYYSLLSPAVRAIALSAAVILEPTAGIASTTNGVLFLTGILAILAMIFGTRTDCQYRTTWRSDVGGCLRVFCQTVCFAVSRSFSCLLHLKTSIKSPKMSQKLSIKYNHPVCPIHFGFKPCWLDRDHLFTASVPRRCGRIRDEKHIRGARRWFAVYLVLTIIAIIPDCQLALHATPGF